MESPSRTTKPDDWTSDKWETPPSLVHMLEGFFGRFDLDPCAESTTAKAPAFYTLEDNGLALGWWGNVFVNPPYSEPGLWCERAVDAVDSGEVERVVMLLPCATDTRWFHSWVLPHAHLVFLQGRVRFLGWQGTPIPSPRSPNLVAVFGSVPDDCPRGLRVVD